MKINPIILCTIEHTQTQTQIHTHTYTANMNAASKKAYIDSGVRTLNVPAYEKYLYEYVMQPNQISWINMVSIMLVCILFSSKKQ